MERSEIPKQPNGEFVTRTVAMPKDTNPNGDIFGGWLMAQMDLGSGILASKRARTRVVTVAVDGMSFLQPSGGGYGGVLRVGRIDRPHLDEDPGRSLGAALHAKPGKPG